MHIAANMAIVGINRVEATALTSFLPISSSSTTNRSWSLLLLHMLLLFLLLLLRLLGKVG